jgi:hypothetical protein
MKPTIAILPLSILLVSSVYAMEQEKAEIINQNHWFNSDAYSIKQVMDDLTSSITSYPNVAKTSPDLTDPQLGNPTCVINPVPFARYVAGFTDGSIRRNLCFEPINNVFDERPCRNKPITALGCTMYSNFRRDALLDGQCLIVAGYKDSSVSFQNSTGGDITIGRPYYGSLITCITPMNNSYIWMIGRKEIPTMMNRGATGENIITLVKNNDDSPIVPKQEFALQKLHTINKIIHKHIQLGSDPTGVPYQIAGLGTYQGKIVVKTTDNNFLLIIPTNNNQ